MRMRKNNSSYAQRVDNSRFLVNPAVKSYATLEVAFLAAQQELERLGGQRSAVAMVASPALARREREKAAKYSRLVMLASRQVPLLRPRVPTFTPMAMTSNGDLARGATEVIEWLTNKFFKRCEAEGPRDDGLAPKMRAETYKRELLHDIHCGLAAGIGMMIAFAGGPPTVKGVH